MHAEYTTPLRQELAEGWIDFQHHAEGLPLLDSFLKESTRLNGTESGTSLSSLLRRLPLPTPIIHMFTMLITSSLRPPQSASTFYLLRWPARADRLLDLHPYWQHQSRRRVLRGPSTL